MNPEVPEFRWDSKNDRAIIVDDTHEFAKTLCELKKECGKMYGVSHTGTCTLRSFLRTLRRYGFKFREHVTGDLKSSYIITRDDYLLNRGREGLLNEVTMIPNKSALRRAKKRQQTKVASKPSSLEDIEPLERCIFLAPLSPDELNVSVNMMWEVFTNPALEKVMLLQHDKKFIESRDSLMLFLH